MNIAGFIRGSRRLCGAAAMVSLFAVSGCFTDSDGPDPPRDAFYFPTGLATSPGGKVLYAANSDFDLQFNGGTVLALDLESLRSAALILQAELDKNIGSAACSALSLSGNNQNLLNPGPCSPLSAAPYIRSSVTIGAFASGLALLPRPSSLGAPPSGESTMRLFVPVRGDPSVTYFDLSDDRDPNAVRSPCGRGDAFCLDCGAEGENQRCGASHRAGEDSGESVRQLTLTVEPVGIAGTQAGDALVVAHQENYGASLLINPWNAKPALEFFLGSLGAGPTEVAALPVPALIAGENASDACVKNGRCISYEPGFLISHRYQSEVSLVRYHADAGSSPRRPFLSLDGREAIVVNTSGTDSRGVAIDSSARRECEEKCGENADASCLKACVNVPLSLFIANRSPPSLVVGKVMTELVEKDGQVTGAYERIDIQDTVPLAFGPSRVALGHILDKNGNRSLRVFTIAFDSRLVFGYDPAARSMDMVIHTGRGPHAMTFDTGGDGSSAYSFMYIAHFTDSYLGVVDLDMRKPQSFGSMLLTVGTPVPPRESK